MKEDKAELGDFVTAKLVGDNDLRQGVFFKDNGDGTIIVRGKLEDYVCEADASTVADEEFAFSRPITDWVRRVRLQLG